MPSRGTHQLIATIAGAALAYYEATQAGVEDPFFEVVGGGLAGWLTGTLPDEIEPALSHWHRAGAHSVAAGGLIACAVPSLRRFATECRRSAEQSRLLAQTTSLAAVRQQNLTSEALSRLAAGFAAGLPAGYLSHLGADALTPRGIPLV